MHRAEHLKSEGNKAYKNHEYKRAAKIYRDAIQIDMRNPILYSNRAQCFLHLEDYERALKDTTSGLNLAQEGKIAVKLYYRQGVALVGLLRHQDAEKSFQNVLQLDPQNKEAKEQLSALSRNSATDKTDCEANSLPMRYLAALNHLDEDKKVKGYKYVLNIEETTYTELFQDTGVDVEFLEFYLHAARYALTKPLIEHPNNVILNHLRVFSGFKKFDLAMQTCGTPLKQDILNIVQNRAPQLLKQYSELIK